MYSGRVNGKEEDLHLSVKCCIMMIYKKQLIHSQAEPQVESLENLRGKGHPVYGVSEQGLKKSAVTGHTL